MISSLLTLAVLCSPTPQQPPTFDVLPLQHLLEPAHGGDAIPAHSLLRVESPENWLADETLRLQQSQLTKALEKLWLSQQSSGGLDHELVGGNLMLRGDDAALKTLRSDVALLARQLTRSVQIEVAVWDATDRETPDAVLDATAYTAFTTNRSQLCRMTATAAAGQVAALQRMRWSPYAANLMVEVAEDSSASLPLMAEYGDGCSALVRPFSLAGTDDLVLHAQFAFAQRRGVVRPMPTGSADVPDLDAPTLESCFGTCSGRVVNGGALAVTLRGHAALGGQVVVTFRAMSAPQPGAAANARFCVLPIDASTTSSLLAAANAERTENASTSSGFVPPAQLTTWLQQATTNQVIVVGGHALVVGDEAAQNGARSLLRSLQDRLLRTVRVTSNGSLPNAAKEGEPDQAPVMASLHQLVGPTLCGRRLTLSRMLETNHLRGVEVQIAASAALVRPVAEVLQLGTWLSCSAMPADGTMAARLELRCTHGAGPVARNLMPGVVLTPAERGEAKAIHVGLVTNGQVIDHGDGPMVPVEGRSWRSTQTSMLQW